MCRDTTGRSAWLNLRGLERDLPGRCQEVKPSLLHNCFRPAAALAIARLAEPTESFFEIIKGLDPHAPIDCDSFPKPPGIKHWFLENEGELRFAGNTMFSYVSRNGVSCELTVKKTLDDGWFTGYFASIHENSFDFVAFQCINNSKKRPFSFRGREFARGNCPKQS